MHSPFVRAAGGAKEPPRRMIAIETNMGILPQYFFPEGAGGRDYRPSPYLELLADFRRDFTVFSGVSHPNVTGGHAADKVFLTAAPHPDSGAFKNSVSLDQVAAEQIGTQTRFPSLVLSCCNGGDVSLSYTRSGVMIPGERSPAALYQRMFVQGNAKEVEARVADLRLGRSILDFVDESAKELQKKIGPQDRDRLDQYFTSVRELEQQLVVGEEWEYKPKPKVDVPMPVDMMEPHELVDRTKQMFNLMRLALETDSTRLVTLFIQPLGTLTNIEGVSHETHSMTHHGNRPEVLAELRKVEEAQLKALTHLLGGLRDANEGGSNLLDRTMVLYGTCMGSANAHNNVNLPVLLAGGGFRHGQHLAFDTKRNYPLPNLYLSMLQRMGLEVDRFASSNGTMRGLEMTSS
jgi:hypothetical protein